MIIAIDFDGTICRDEYPSIGALVPGTHRYINQLHTDGHYIIIWTCRTGERLLEAINFLLAHGVKFNRINEEHHDVLAKYGAEGRKIFADVYVDDKQVGGLPTWSEIYEYISQKAKER